MAFFATIIAHLVLSRKWIGATAKAVSNGKRMKPMATVRMVLGILLAISMVALMASSAAISNLLAGAGIDLAGAASGTWALVHTVSSYALCCLVVAHLGIHWASIASAFKIPYNPERRAAISTGVTALGALGVAAIGLAGYKAVTIPASAAVADDAAASASEEYSQVSDVPYGKSTGSSSSSSTSATSSGKGTKGSKKRSGESAGSASAQGANTDSEQSSSGSNSGNPSNPSANSSSSTVTGTCTLCRKNCPLSAPKCDKPYEAGLL